MHTFWQLSLLNGCDDMNRRTIAMINVRWNDDSPISDVNEIPAWEYCTLHDATNENKDRQIFFLHLFINL